MADTLEVSTATVPIIPTGTPSTITEVDIPQHSATINAAEELGLSPVKTLSPKQALGADKTLELEAMEADMQGKPLERDATGKFISRKEAPKPKEEPEGTPQAKQVAIAKPEPARAKLISKAKPVEAVVEPVKIKLGDKEMTADEISARFKELEDQAKKPVEAAKPAEAPKEPTPEEKQAQAAQLREKRLAFIADQGANLNLADYGIDITEASMDKILSGGPEAVKEFATLLRQSIAASHAMDREWTADKVGGSLAKFREQFAPLMERENQIAEYRREQTFLTANPEIQAHEKGAEISRQIRNQLHDNYQQIQQRIATGTASPQDKAAASLYDAATPEQFEASVAYYTKEQLSKLPKAAPLQQATLVVAKPKVEPPNKPSGGDRPGGAPTGGSNESDQGKFIRDLKTAGK